ncbi:MAG: DISARM system helicase DrmA [Limisphaerales bacterium]
MSIPTELPLRGFVNPRGELPAFLVPVFGTPEQLWIQDSLGDGLVCGFHPCATRIETVVHSQGESRLVKAGEPLLHAFQFPDAPPLCGAKTDIQSILRRRLDDFTMFPFLRLEVLRFLEEGDAYRGALHVATVELAKSDQEIAQAWKDLMMGRFLQGFAEGTATEVRRQIVEALRIDLVGPANDHPFARELLPQSPRRWYLTGLLVPSQADQQVKSSGDDEMAEEAPEKVSDADDTETSEQQARVNFLPSSMGLSVLLKPDTKALEAVVRWGDYLWETEEAIPEPDEDEVARRYEEEAGKLDAPPDPNGPDLPTVGKKGRPRIGYRRESREETLLIPISAEGGKVSFPVPNSRGLHLVGSVRPLPHIAGSQIPSGSHAVSVFLVNDRVVKGRETYRAFVFQTEIALRCAGGFLGRPDLRGVIEVEKADFDESVADLHYRDVLEYAVGHGVAAEPVGDVEGACTAVRTCWIPSAEVERVDHFNPPGLELNMEALGSLADSTSAVASLSPLAVAYREWIALQEAGMDALDLPKAQRDTADDLVRSAKVAADRIEAGIAQLGDPVILNAFKMANRAMARAARQRGAIQEGVPPTDVPSPQWRAFQLAFVLMNLQGIADPAHTERAIVDLLFFPTGGGKTEAYLGLAAFTLVLRRLRNPGPASAGVSIIMRYTLRLLTLDQLGRAAALMCALEIERAEAGSQLGDWPFEIGLWVGSAATPNRMGFAGDKSAGADKTAYTRTTRFKGKSDRYAAPIPIESCPWCGTKFTPDSWELHPIGSTHPVDLRVACADERCLFSAAQNRTLPIVGVDEPIYRRLPCFLIATVDKFAALPWTGRVGCLFGHVQRWDKEGFYGPCDPNKGQPLPKGGLLPPDLIVQDELHLISGPLGTIAGIYEVAIEQLCSRPLPGGGVRRPKIVASTATVRRADRQIRALFGRAQTAIFPPPGPNRNDSYFARATPVTSDAPGRLYLGIAAQGRSMKVILLRAALALLSGAQTIYQRNGGRVLDNPADPYMTLLSYFNSLRELGGSRRIVEDEIKSRLELYWKRRRIEPEEQLFSSRYILHTPLELTSRVDTDAVAEAKHRLAADFASDERVDVALATNMISVGLDIVRLGLMLVFGQPKTSSEYIQATSRVGRQKDKPGLIVTLLNIHRPRDRSHYERFAAYHKTFYRSVEATSVTPFSPRALDRALAAALVGLCRHEIGKLTPSAGASIVQTHYAALLELAKHFGRRALEHDVDKSTNGEGAELEAHVTNRAQALLADWVKIVIGKLNEGVGLNYQKYEDTVSQSALIRDFMDPELANLPAVYRRFRANRSMRDVEPPVDIFPKPSQVGTNS